MSSEENEKDLDDIESIPGYYDDEEPVSAGTYTLDDIENLDLGDGIENGLEDNFDDVADEPVASSKSEKSSKRADSKIEKVEEERDSYLETLRKVQADFENYKKRVLRDTQEFSEAKSIKLIGELLGVLDNFELALNHFDEVEQDDRIQSLKKGIDLVYSEFYSALEKQGLERIEANGEPFDPQFHEAVLHDDSGENESEIVVEVLRPGYAIRGKVVRPAMVKVSK